MNKKGGLLAYLFWMVVGFIAGIVLILMFFSDWICVIWCGC